MMNALYTMPDACEVAAAAGSNGWAAATVIVADVDEDYMQRFERCEFELKPGKAQAEWEQAYAGLRPKLRLVTGGATISATDVAEAERIGRPAVAWQDGPVVAWTERRGGRWRLMMQQGGNAECVVETDAMLRAPAVCASGQDILVACDTDVDGERRVRVWRAGSGQVFEAGGSRPRLEGSAAGQAWLVFERNATDAVTLHTVRFRGTKPGEEIALPRPDAYSINATLAHDPQHDVLYVTWESSPAWGHHEWPGQHRDLHLWTLAADAETFSPAAGTEDGRLALPREAFVDMSPFNFTTIYPSVCLLDGQPLVSYRRFRYVGAKCFGWDTYIVRWLGNRWTAPARVTPSVGPPDRGGAILPVPDGPLGVFIACDHIARTSFKEMDLSDPPKRASMPVTDHRLDVYPIDFDNTLPAPAFPARFEAPYAIAPGAKGIGSEPVALPNPPDGLQLVWGDLHAHTAYSKCTSANDGVPDDVLRYERNVFDARVLCLTDHVEYVRAPEIFHILNRVEAWAGGSHVPLYGVEWAMRPAHHTNFYAKDREVFDRLRGILLSADHLTPVYQRIRQELPAGSVVALRHFHGMNEKEYGAREEKRAETVDPDLEVAMEAMQTRGNMMMPDGPRGADPFPTDYLNRGVKVGLVGGSDHSRTKFSNSFCLTGFWVPAVTPDAVWAALRERRTVATSNGKLALYPTLEGQPMGAELTATKPLRFAVQVAAARSVRRVCLIRDGEFLPWVEVNCASASLELVDGGVAPGEHWYVVTAEAESSGAKGPILAHASPFFVRVGRD